LSSVSAPWAFAGIVLVLSIGEDHDDSSSFFAFQTRERIRQGVVERRSTACLVFVDRREAALALAGKILNQLGAIRKQQNAHLVLPSERSHKPTRPALHGLACLAHAATP